MMNFKSTLHLDPERVFGHVGDARPLPGRSAALIFNQPSTRTRTAFELAAKRLGVTTVSHFAYASAQEKGESLRDMSLVLQQMVDVIVVRDDDAQELPGRVINAGSRDDHPTQALTDLYVMKREGLLKSPTCIIWPEEGHRPRCMIAFQRLATMMGVPLVDQDDFPEVYYVSRESDDWKLSMALDQTSRKILHPGPWCYEMEGYTGSERFLGWKQAAASPLIKSAILRLALS